MNCLYIAFLLDARTDKIAVLSTQINPLGVALRAVISKPKNQACE
jgi:hypothetical protein